MANVKSPLRSEGGRRGNFHNLINGNYAAKKKALGVTVCVCAKAIQTQLSRKQLRPRGVCYSLSLSLSDTVHMFFFLSFQEGRYVKSKDFDGIGLTPYDPYHNSTFVVSGKSKNQEEYDYGHKKCSSIGTNGLCTFRICAIFEIVFECLPKKTMHGINPKTKNLGRRIALSNGFFCACSC